MSTSPMMTVKEVSAYLRVHPATIYKMVRCGKLPAFKIGSDWRISLTAVESWAREALEQENQRRQRK